MRQIYSRLRIALMTFTLGLAVMWTANIFAITLLITCFLSVITYSQTDQLPALKQQVEGLLAQERYGELIDVGEKIVKLEKRLGPSNAANYMDSLLLVASWKRTRLVARAPDSTSALAKNEHDIVEIEKDYRELISAASKANDLARLATANLELARFYIGHRTRASEEDVEKLLLKSVSLRDAGSQNQEFTTILAVGELAALYYRMGDLEKFYPLSRRYIASLETRSPEEKRELLPFLRIYADFLLTIDRKAEANEFSKQIAAIQGAPYGPYAGKYIIRRIDPWPPKIFFGGPNKRTREHRERVLNAPKSPNKPGDNDSPKSSKDADEKDTGSKGLTTRTVYWRTLAGNYPRIVESKVVDYQTKPNQTVSDLNTYVIVLIDESGKVVEASPHSQTAIDQKFLDDIRKRALTWKFKPLVLDGQPHKMRATIRVTVMD